MKVISTNKAPSAIGTYSQATKHCPWVFISGQIPLVPETMLMHDGDIREQISQVFENLLGICQAAGGNLSNIMKLTIYLTDLGDFSNINEIMANYFSEPYPARAAVEVSALPKGAAVEIDAIMVVED